jgi:WD40 repeat protein
MKSLKFTFALTLFLVGISACTRTAQIPTPTPANEATTPTPTVPASAYPADLEVITPDNVHRLEQLERWGDGYIFDAALSPDGTILAVRTARGIDFYDPETLEITDHFDVATIFPNNDRWMKLPIAISPNGDFLAYTNNAKSIYIWNLDSNQLVSEFDLKYLFWIPSSLEFSPDSNFLSINNSGPSGFCDGIAFSIEIYSLQGGNIFRESWCPGLRASFEFTNAGQFFMIKQIFNRSNYPTSDTAFYQLNLQSGHITEDIYRINYSDPNDPLTTDLYIYNLSPDGQFLASLSLDSESTYTEILDADSMAVLDTVEGWINFLPSIDGIPQWQDRSEPFPSNDTGCERVDDFNSKIIFRDESQALILTSGRPYDAMELWDISTCTIMKRIVYPSASQSIFTTNGEELITTNGTEVFSWNLHSGEVQQLPGPVTLEEFVNEGATNPYVVSEEEDEITISDAETNELVSTLFTSIQLNYTNDSPETIRTPYYYDFTFSPDGRLLLGRGSSLIYVWDTQTGRLLWEIPPDYVIEHITFSPNGRLIAVSCADGLVRLWGVPEEPTQQE